MVAMEQKNGAFEHQTYAVSIVSTEMVDYKSRGGNTRLVPFCAAHGCACMHIPIHLCLGIDFCREGYKFC